MKNIAQLPIILMALLFTVSCTQSEQPGVFPKEYTLQGDSVSTQATIYVSYYLGFEDGNVILPSPKNRADTLLHFYSTPDLKLRLSTGVVGHSKMEFQDSPYICHSPSGGLYIKGYTPWSIRKVQIKDDKLVDLGHFTLETPGAPNNMHIIDDSLFFYTLFSKNLICSYNFKQQKAAHEFNLHDLYNCRDRLLMGSLSVNNHLAVYAMQYKREIVVLNAKDLSYIKTIKREYENQDKEVENNAQDFTIYYTGGFSTQDKFYLMYRGFKINSSDIKCDIEVYDNNMNPLCVYHLNPDPGDFVVDEKNGYIYGYTNPDYIYRYKLPK